MNTATPLLPLLPDDDRLYAKIEYLHPSGSIKHRSIPPLLDDLLATGELGAGQRIAIRSAGSAAVATAWAGTRLGCPVLAVLPPAALPNLVRMLAWLGADYHLLPPKQASELMADLHTRTGTYVLEQAAEPRLVDHYRPVAAEILDQLPLAAAIVVGIGTGLSITGIAREVHDRHASCQVFGVEPAEAAIASGRPWAPHAIPGLAPPIAQPLLDHTLLAGIITVPSADAWRHARDTGRRDGLPIGPSAGAAVAAARRLRAEGVCGPIVAVCACAISDYLDGAPDQPAAAVGPPGAPHATVRP